MTHLHITAWVLALILLFVSHAFYKKGNKAGKILHMILRLDYLLILYSGGDLFAESLAVNSPIFEVIIKGVAGVWVIAAMEMILVKTSKSKPAKNFWIQLVIALVIALVLGFGRLPLSV
ncbi:YisL family protein [Gracilibacillus massiliensis]|uniref:YisL family protein n=1 Tax=Gracilibacillus massiliensis TaxID=1564956 RepID=UPI00071CEDBF|nr:YisL family protein [Gracilibacillus massiliensis]